jgi:hypothetical protein
MERMRRGVGEQRWEQFIPWVAEERVSGEVAIDFVLIGDAAHPVTVEVTVDVAASERRGPARITCYGRSLSAECNDAVLDAHIGPEDIEPASFVR